MLYLQFASTAFAPPFVGWLLNLAVRRSEASNTSGADWLLVLIVLNFTALVDSETFGKFIRYSEWKEHASWCFGIAFTIAFVAWLGHIYLVEPHLRKDAGDLWQTLCKRLAFFVGWTFAISVCAANVMLFTYKPQ